MKKLTQYDMMLLLLQRNSWVEVEYAKRMGINNPAHAVRMLKDRGHEIVRPQTGVYRLVVG